MIPNHIVFIILGFFFHYSKTTYKIVFFANAKTNISWCELFSNYFVIIIKLSFVYISSKNQYLELTVQSSRYLTLKELN